MAAVENELARKDAEIARLTRQRDEHAKRISMLGQRMLEVRLKIGEWAGKAKNALVAADLQDLYDQMSEEAEE